MRTIPGVELQAVPSSQWNTTKPMPAFTAPSTVRDPRVTTRTTHAMPRIVGNVGASPTRTSCPDMAISPPPIPATRGRGARTG